MKREECSKHGAIKFITILGWLVIILGVREIIKRSEE